MPCPRKYRRVHEPRTAQCRLGHRRQVGKPGRTTPCRGRASACVRSGRRARRDRGPMQPTRASSRRRSNPESSVRSQMPRRSRAVRHSRPTDSGWRPRRPRSAKSTLSPHAPAAHRTQLHQASDPACCRPSCSLSRTGEDQRRGHGPIRLHMYRNRAMHTSPTWDESLMV
jgi:hypothetical protein